MIPVPYGVCTWWPARYQRKACEQAEQVNTNTQNKSIEHDAVYSNVCSAYIYDMAWHHAYNHPTRCMPFSSFTIFAPFGVRACVCATRTAHSKQNIEYMERIITWTDTHTAHNTYAPYRQLGRQAGIVLVPLLSLPLERAPLPYQPLNNLSVYILPLP